MIAQLDFRFANTKNIWKVNAKSPDSLLPVHIQIKLINYLT